MADQTQHFDPLDHQQGPARALIVKLRGLRLGERVVLPDGTVIRSVGIMHGSNLERRYAVVPSEGSSTPIERHRALTLGRSAFRTASEAAMNALNQKGESEVVDAT